MTKLFLAGTFDNFHIGHQFFLWSGRCLCETMTIVVARDKTVELKKGRLPINSEKSRIARIQKENISFASVRLGRADGDFIQTLREESPDILYLGYDQIFDETIIEDIFPTLHVIRAKPYFPEFFKSSKFNILR